ncbi:MULTISPECIES: hypothetical protein [unclassified Streptomyces]|uniref:hypothetical protein n=1 Tax=unclassified Streptomyces TaxID=2593676 RepID=UPI002E2D6C04|nr:hypothetical protein [Streptomyces sp. NBC_00223]
MTTDAEQQDHRDLTVGAAGPTLRLLPWTGENGQPAYLSSDRPGPLWKLADQMEAVQLGLAGQLLGHVRAVLDGPEASPRELCFLIARLTEALLDALRVAHSRGARLSPPAPTLDSTEELTAAAQDFSTFLSRDTQ